MTNVMFHVLIILSAFSCVYSSDPDITITVTPSLDDGPITWKQTVVISCNWTPGSRMYGDVILGDGESIYSSEDYEAVVSLEDPEQRVFFTTDDDIGSSQLTIKDVTKADEHDFACQVSRKGSSSHITLNILEPPLTGVTNFNAVAEFTTVALTWDAVEGASVYNVAWRPAGSVDWTDVDVTTNSHTFEGLAVASDFEAKVDASNAAGIREGIEPAETTFTTKDNRPPHPVDNLAISGSPLYDETSITIAWELTSNADESRIITSIVAAVENEEAGEDEAAIEPQILAADATSTTFVLPGPGEYVFTVKTVNDFSEGVETSATVIKSVKETTVKPTTVKPTTVKITTPKKVTTKKPTKAPTDPPKLATEAPKNVLCGDIRTFEPLPGKLVELKCTVPSDASYDATAVTWSYSAGEDGAVVGNEELLNSESVEIQSVVLGETESSESILRIPAADTNSAGTWKCHLDGEQCKFAIVMPGAAKGAAFTAAFSGTLILATLIVALLH